MQIRDSSLDIVKALTASYYAEIESYKEYVEYASEWCSFNHSTGLFNNFFVDHMESTYDTPSTGSWSRAPLVYYMHHDLLYNTFEGDLARIVEASKKKSEEIGPYAVTLVNVWKFKE